LYTIVISLSEHSLLIVREEEEAPTPERLGRRGAPHPSISKAGQGSRAISTCATTTTTTSSTSCYGSYCGCGTYALALSSHSTLHFIVFKYCASHSPPAPPACARDQCLSGRSSSRWLGASPIPTLIPSGWSCSLVRIHFNFNQKPWMPTKHKAKDAIREVFYLLIREVP